MHTARRGFTLIEILVAVVVLSILALAAYGGLDALISTREQTKAQSERFHHLELAMVILDRDLDQAISRSIRQISGARSPAMRGGQNSVPLLAFTRAGWPNPLQKPRSGLIRIDYRLSGGKLIRNYWPVLDRVVDSPPARQVLLTGVTGIKLRFLDGFGHWHRYWPPLNAEPGQYLRRDPVAIEITLETRRWGTLRRLIEIAP